MQLLTLAQAQLEPFKTQFKYRIYSVSLALLITAGIAITALVLGVRAWNETTPLMPNSGVAHPAVPSALTA